jgi:hypothetical protein
MPLAGNTQLDGDPAFVHMLPRNAKCADIFGIFPRHCAVGRITGETSDGFGLLPWRPV